MSVFLECLREEFEHGLRIAVDPANANQPPLRRRATTLNSAWFMNFCPVCHQRFREGDLVRLCPRCEKPYHDDPQFNLHCWDQKFAFGAICTEGGQDRFSDQPIAACSYTWDGYLPDLSSVAQTAATSLSAESVNQFIAGLRESWPTFGDKKICKVQPGDAMIDRLCPWCRLRIRAGDWVVECPCGCGTYFHEDIFRHLTCWNEWNGVSGNNYCPNTSQPYEKKA